VVVGRGLPRQHRRAAAARTLHARGDEVLGDALAAGPLGDEEVVHDPDPRRLRRRPRPEDRREPDRRALLVAGHELKPLARRVGDQRPTHRQQRLVARRDLVEVAVAAHQGEQLREIGLGGDVDRDHRTAS
jgi:hypothetical protein